jgi:hypothetical protein
VTVFIPFPLIGFDTRDRACAVMGHGLINGFGCVKVGYIVKDYLIFWLAINVYAEFGMMVDFRK